MVAASDFAPKESSPCMRGWTVNRPNPNRAVRNRPRAYGGVPVGLTAFYNACPIVPACTG